MAGLILASASPRRRELLSKMAADFEVLVSGVEEIEPPACHWSAAVLLNAVAKARAVAARRPEALVLAADTVIELDGQILGKPADMAGARAMLRKMSGTRHLVSTGVCLASVEGRVLCEFVESSQVLFRELTEDAIELYLSKVHVLDKAGAYAIQEHGHIIIERIEGSFDNVIGLPSERVAEAIGACGFGRLLRQSAS
jgi:septum formation protein